MSKKWMLGMMIVASNMYGFGSEDLSFLYSKYRNNVAQQSANNLEAPAAPRAEINVAREKEGRNHCTLAVAIIAGLAVTYGLQYSLSLVAERN